MDQRNAVTSNHASSTAASGRVQWGILNAGFLFFHFNFGRSANFDYRNVPLASFATRPAVFLTIVVGGRFFNLLTDSSNTAPMAAFSPTPSMMVVVFC